jgi:hypothetical protein
MVRWGKRNPGQTDQKEAPALEAKVTSLRAKPEGKNTISNSC